MSTQLDFSAVTTRAGDKGESRLADGWTGPKDHPRFRLVGELDELQSYLGVVRRDLRQLDFPGFYDPEQELREVQQALGAIMSLAAAPPGRPNTNAEGAVPPAGGGAASPARRADPARSASATEAGTSDPHTQAQQKLAELERSEAWLLSRITTEGRFIIPGDSPESASLDYARALCRRAERALVSVIRSREQPRPDLHECQHYINRLSDWLFVLARYVEQHAR